MLHWCLEAPPETERVWGGLCTISIFNLSTVELDNALQRLSFAGLVATDSARKRYGVATTF